MGRARAGGAVGEERVVSGSGASSTFLFQIYRDAGPAISQWQLRQVRASLAAAAAAAAFAGRKVKAV